MSVSGPCGICGETRIGDPSTVWVVKSVGKPYDHLDVTLTVATVARPVLAAIERAAKANGIELERVKG